MRMTYRIANPNAFLKALLNLRMKWQISLNIDNLFHGHGINLLVHHTMQVKDFTSGLAVIVFFSVVKRLE